MYSHQDDFHVRVNAIKYIKTFFKNLDKIYFLKDFISKRQIINMKNCDRQ